MKTIALGVLFAVTIVSLAGCHWRHRRWRNHYDRSFNATQAVDQVAQSRRAATADLNA
jgi:hypothetical protein